MVRQIILGRSYELRVAINGYRPPSQRFEAIDLLTYDPDPESAWHLVGLGSTEAEAKLDVLEMIADVLTKADQTAGN